MRLPPPGQVSGDVGDDVDVETEWRAELLLDGGEVVAEEVEDLFGSRDGEGAHIVLVQFRELFASLTVVGELEGDAEVAGREQSHDLLQSVAILADDADGVALNGGLGFELGLLDDRDDLLRPRS